MEPEPSEVKWIVKKSNVYELVFAGTLKKSSNYALHFNEKLRSERGTYLLKSPPFKFSTPTAQVVSTIPEYGSFVKSLTPLVFVQFNQAIKKKDVLEAIEFQTAKGSIPAVAATEQEIAAHTEIASQAQQVDPSHWICVRPSKDIPKHASITVKLRNVRNHS